MRLLIITQKVDKSDDILGFFHRWLIEFSKNVESLTVICLEKGECDLPKNVKVFSLGKERGVGKSFFGRIFTKIGYIKNLFKYLWSERKNYDTVFVHMNPIYLVVAGWFLKILRKPMYLWYTHKNVDFKLKFSSIFVQNIFTASDKSLRFNSPKKVVTGHGIDTTLFKPDESVLKENIILTVGRVSEIKQNIEMLDLLKKHLELKLVVVGEPITEQDKKYFNLFKENISNNDLSKKVEFVGSLSQEKLPPYYMRAKIFVNLSKTGSLDKAVLEALSMNVPVYTTNDAFIGGDFPIFQNFEEALISTKQTHNFIVKNHSLENLVTFLISKMSNKNI